MRRGSLHLWSAVAALLPLTLLSPLSATAQTRPVETSVARPPTRPAAMRYPNDSAANAARAAKARAQQAATSANDSAVNAARAADAAAQRAAVAQRAPLVPRIVGMPIADARRTLIKALDAQLGDVTSRETRDQALDSVVAAQFPAESTLYNRSQRVTATVWAYVAVETVTVAVDTVVVPDVAKRHFANAREMLQDSGLQVAPSKLSIADLDRAYVTGQTPLPYARVPRNSIVVLTLFVPPAPRPRVDSVIVPQIPTQPRKIAPVSFTLGMPALSLALLGAIAVLLTGIVIFAIIRWIAPKPSQLPIVPIIPTIALGLPVPTPVPSVLIAAAKPLVAQTIDVSITAEPPQTSVTVDAYVAAATAFVTYGEST